MSENKKPTQCERILDYMKRFGSITQLEALQDLACFRLASRISELRKDGWAIKAEQVAVKNRFQETCYIKKYSLEVAKC